MDGLCRVAYWSRKNRTGIAPIQASVVRETIALLKTGSALYSTEKIVTRTAVRIADLQDADGQLIPRQTQSQADPPGKKRREDQFEPLGI